MGWRSGHLQGPESGVLCKDPGEVLPAGEEVLNSVTGRRARILQPLSVCGGRPEAEKLFEDLTERGWGPLVEDAVRMAVRVRLFRSPKHAGSTTGTAFVGINAR